MGKQLRQQRRGKGSGRFRAPSHRYIGKIRYTSLGSGEKNKEGKVVDIVHSVGKKTPVAIVDFGDRKELMIPAGGTDVGKIIRYHDEVESGSIVELGKIPEGTKVFNIELRPDDGGKLCRAPGSFAFMSTRDEKRCVIELPSKKQIVLDSKCRATIGVPAGAGRAEKPFMKAGHRYFAMRATGRYYPTVKGVSKNPVDHPFGGKTKPGKHLTISRHAPPGRKVGSLSPKRTGKKKR